MWVVIAVIFAVSRLVNWALPVLAGSKESQFDRVASQLQPELPPGASLKLGSREDRPAIVANLELGEASVEDAVVALDQTNQALSQHTPRFWKSYVSGTRFRSNGTTIYYGLPTSHELESSSPFIIGLPADSLSFSSANLITVYNNSPMTCTERVTQWSQAWETLPLPEQTVEAVVGICGETLVSAYAEQDSYSTSFAALQTVLSVGPDPQLKRVIALADGTLFLETDNEDISAYQRAWPGHPVLKKLPNQYIGFDGHLREM